MAQKKINILIRETGELLLRNRNPEGYWDGRLSSSALGVAVAVIALHFYDADAYREEIESGLRWLVAHANVDGGFGDTPESASNVSTSLLCYAALSKCRPDKRAYENQLNQLEAYLIAQKIELHSERMIQTVLNYYQTDRTFSVPILVTCALCGIPDQKAFDCIPQLPFELALLPRAFYRLLNLNVVSYAIPALIAVGMAQFKFKTKKNPLMRLIRLASLKKALGLLEKIKPESGGFLEAIPLTAFVCICLTEAGYRDLPVVNEGIAFLKKTQRKEGSWPIDIDLSTWVTSLSVKSFRSEINAFLEPKLKVQLTAHYLKIQQHDVHPFNGTPPGGWGWTHFSGSVPDCDDTPGAVLALLALQPSGDDTVKHAVINGCNWMMQLQNTDGGFPTFCKGWGKLPFDRSCADLTGHAVFAFAKTMETFGNENPHELFPKLFHSLSRALNFLENNQQDNGSWLPLWFGNQHTADHTNPVYGTARVLSYLNDAMECKGLEEYLRNRMETMSRKAAVCLVMMQNDDGSWGGDRGIIGSIEETALSLTALCPYAYPKPLQNGYRWLEQKIKSEGFAASPIGLYFASLWYSEKLYPVTATLECLIRAKETGKIIE